jgi:protein O-GlcNAc transferase
VAHNNLGSVLSDMGQPAQALSSLRQALQHQLAYPEAASNILFTLSYVPGTDANTCLAEARQVGAQLAQGVQPYTAWHHKPGSAGPLRVGLVSGDLGEHPVGYFLESVLAALKARAGTGLALMAYNSGTMDDALTQRIKASCHSWRRVVEMSDERLAQCIHDDHIDILLDLSGHTAHNRLPAFAFKPAPVQASWLGYFATTGLAAMDYVIADPLSLPEAPNSPFTEHIWRLPQTRLCFTPPDAVLPVSALPSLGNGHTTFGCFNNLSKMNDAVVALWARVLKAVDGSHLFLKARQLDDPVLRQSTRDRFAAQGIVADRLTLEGLSPRVGYLATYGQVDIALDPFPFTGGATSAEALWMGVPVLTLAGDCMVARQGACMMTNAGLPDWVATDQDDYLARAVAHAADHAALAALRSRLREQVLASPVFDAPRFATQFEAALHGMWQHSARAQGERGGGYQRPSGAIQN